MHLYGSLALTARAQGLPLAASHCTLKFLTWLTEFLSPPRHQVNTNTLIQPPAILWVRISKHNWNLTLQNTNIKIMWDFFSLTTSTGNSSNIFQPLCQVSTEEKLSLKLLGKSYSPTLRLGFGESAPVTEKCCNGIVSQKQMLHGNTESLLYSSFPLTCTYTVML